MAIESTSAIWSFLDRGPRFIQHVVFAPPWLIPSDRKRNDPAFLERTTPLRRALLGEWKRPEEPFGAGYDRPPFED